MHLRISFDDHSGSLPTRPLGCQPRPSPGQATSFFDLDSTETADHPLLLFVGEEPEIGMRFTYTDLDWEVVDYRDGWIARLVVD